VHVYVHISLRTDDHAFVFWPKEHCVSVVVVTSITTPQLAVVGRSVQGLAYFSTDDHAFVFWPKEHCISVVVVTSITTSRLAVVSRSVQGLAQKWTVAYNTLKKGRTNLDREYQTIMWAWLWHSHRQRQESSEATEVLCLPIQFERATLKTTLSQISTHPVMLLKRARTSCRVGRPLICPYCAGTVQVTCRQERQAQEEIWHSLFCGYREAAFNIVSWHLWVGGKTQSGSRQFVPQQDCRKDILPLHCHRILMDGTTNIWQH